MKKYSITLATNKQTAPVLADRFTPGNSGVGFFVEVDDPGRRREELVAFVPMQQLVKVEKVGEVDEPE